MATSDTNNISNFVKYNRGKIRLTQEELAEKAGVGLRFIRELEQGKETLRMDKVNQVLALFGYQAVPGNERIKDPYEILMNYSNKNVRIHLNLKNKTELVGFITGAIYEDNEIKGWKFVSNNNAIEYQKSENSNLIQTIEHADIESIENV
jgi:y4mF family transcriptional regulator